MYIYIYTYRDITYLKLFGPKYLQPYFKNMGYIRNILRFFQRYSIYCMMAVS